MKAESKMGAEEHLALLKQAIAANLRARVEHDLRCAKKPVDLKVVNAFRLLETDPD
jgi:hypothetical protein